MSFRLVLNSNVFIIPSDFRCLSDVNLIIYKELIATHQYIVQSNVSREIFQSFINNWVFGDIPEINANNLMFYDLLSKEFDRMTDILKMVKNNLSKTNFLHAKCNNDTLKLKIYNSIDKIERNKKLFSKTINFLFNCNRHYPKFNEIKTKLKNAYLEENIKAIRDLTQNPFTIEENGLLFILNEDEKTAGVYGRSDSRDSFDVPYSLNYKSQNYIVTSIEEYAFAYDENIKTIQFPENSELKIIDDFSFGISSIEEIKIPSKVFKIGERAFVNCDHIKRIEFAEISELKIIEFEAFAYSNLRSILIPSSVTTICNRAFNACFDLIEFNI